MSVISEKAIDLVLDLLRAAGVTKMKGDLPDADVKLMCYIAELEARAEKAEAMVARLIELGDVINGDKDSVWTLQTIKECWTEDVTEWKEHEE